MDKKVTIILEDQTIKTNEAFIIVGTEEGKTKTIFSAEDVKFIEKVLGTSLVNILAFVHKLAGEESYKQAINAVQRLLNKIRGGEVDVTEREVK